MQYYQPIYSRKVKKLSKQNFSAYIIFQSITIVLYYKSVSCEQTFDYTRFVY